MSKDELVSASVSDVEVAVSAACAGAGVVRAAYGREVSRHPTAAQDFATQPDLEVERVILSIIAAARPHDGRIGEETGRMLGSNSRCWLVDPLCGTLNFSARTPLVAVNVALLDGAITLACASADPIADELFWSDGQRAYRRTQKDDQIMRPSAVTRLVDVNCDGPLDRPFVGPQLLADAHFRAAFEARVTSTTLAVAWVAAGRRAAYISDGWFTDNVHFAAGIGLCLAAGCTISDLAGRPLGTNRGLIAAADAQTHEQLVEIMRPHLRQVPA